MLVLSRKSHEVIHIGNQITITILRIKGRTVRVGVDAPPEFHVRRGELKPLPPQLPAVQPRRTGHTAAASRELRDEQHVPSQRRRQQKRTAQQGAKEPQGAKAQQRPRFGQWKARTTKDLMVLAADA